MDWDAVAPLSPFDRVASQVTSKGEHYDPHHALGKVHSSEPLPMRDLTNGEKHNPEFIDFSGSKFGRLTVMGISGDVKSNKIGGMAWVVRCVCGAYEIRRTKYVKACVGGNNPGLDEPMCDWCNATRKLQLGYGRGIPEEKRHFNKQKAGGE